MNTTSVQCEFCDQMITADEESALRDGKIFHAECVLEYKDEEYAFACESREAVHDDDDYLIDGVGFADPGGNSALRAATKNNPRIYSCPTCQRRNVLTKIDKAHGYQCDSCADRAERGGDY